MKEVFKEKYLEYEPKITLEIFTLVWNRLIELGYKSFNNYTVEERYGEFKGLYKYFRTTQDHPNEFNCYNNGYPYTKTTVEEILGYNPFIKETTTAKDWNKVTEEELLEEAKRRYLIGCKVKLISRNTGGDFKNEVRLLKNDIKVIENNKQTAALQYEMALSEIDDKIESAEEALKDAYRAVKIEDINNNDAMKQFSGKYWNNIDTKESNLEALKEERKAIVKDYEDHLEARNKKIAKREARIKAIS